MTYLRSPQKDLLNNKGWPPIPDGMSGIEIVAVARMVERICGTAAAAGYLAEAIATFDKKARTVHANYVAKYGDDRVPTPRGGHEPGLMSGYTRQRTSAE